MNQEKILVFAARAEDLELHWLGNGVSIKNSDLDKYLVAFAREFEKFIKSLNLKCLDDAYAEVRLDLTGAWIDINVNSNDGNFSVMQSEYGHAQFKIGEVLDTYMSRSDSQPNEEGTDPVSLSTKNQIDGKIIQAIAKLLSETNSTIEFDLQAAGTKIIQPKKTSPIKVPPIINENEKIIDVGRVESFKEKGNKVVLFKLEKSSVELILAVENERLRKLILWAQYKRRKIEVEYNPLIVNDKSDNKMGKVINIKILPADQLEIQGV